MTGDLTPTESKGRKHYWRAVVVWWIGAFGATTLYAFAPGISLIGKLLIGIALVGSAILLLRANIFSRYAAGTTALLGMLSSFPGACAVFDPETQVQGGFSLIFLIICGFVWHAFLISDDVSAYLKWFRISKGLKPEA